MPPSTRDVKHKRRFCKVIDCCRTVKSQGLCQRHGAKTRTCKVETCNKQAQGNFDGMCKGHFKKVKKELIAVPPNVTDIPKPIIASVYDKVIPDSICWNGKDTLPLILHLKAGFDEQKPRGWHRNEERRSRGLVEVLNPAIQLQGWERELVWLETCLLSGNSQVSFRHLARAWGRDKGFHMVLTQFICERQGNVERKKRMKGESILTKKMPKKSVPLNPGEDDSLDEWDQVDLELLGELDGPSDRFLMPWDDVDPTAICTSFCSKTGKKSAVNMSILEEQDSSCSDDNNSSDNNMPIMHTIQEPDFTNEAVMTVPPRVTRHHKSFTIPSEKRVYKRHGHHSIQPHSSSAHVTPKNPSSDIQTIQFEQHQPMIPPPIHLLIPQASAFLTPPSTINMTEIYSVTAHENQYRLPVRSHHPAYQMHSMQHDYTRAELPISMLPLAPPYPPGDALMFRSDYIQPNPAALESNHSFEKQHPKATVIESRVRIGS